MAFLFINHQPSRPHPNEKGIKRCSTPDEAKMRIYGAIWKIKDSNLIVNVDLNANTNSL